MSLSQIVINIVIRRFLTISELTAKIYPIIFSSGNLILFEYGGGDLLS